MKTSTRRAWLGAAIVVAVGCTAAPVDGPPPGEGEGLGEGEGEGEGDPGPSEGEGEGEGEPDNRACGDGVVVGCVADGDDFDCTLQHDGLTRRYTLHVPPGYAQRPAGGVALVFSFHGLNTTAAVQAYVSQMSADADEAGYVLVYPEGTGSQSSQSFNSGNCCGGAFTNDVDDVGFTLAMIDQISDTLCIDARKIYANGWSNGGHMAYRLACEHADVFAAVASVAGVVTTSSCSPTRPVPVLHFHGTDDLIVGYETGIDGFHGAEDMVDDWSERNGCSGDPTISYQQGDVVCQVHSACSGGSAAELCTVDGGGHTWPGGNAVPFLGSTTDDISATGYMSAFFAAHPMP